MVEVAVSSIAESCRLDLGLVSGEEEGDEAIGERGRLKGLKERSLRRSGPGDMRRRGGKDLKKLMGVEEGVMSSSGGGGGITPLAVI